MWGKSLAPKNGGTAKTGGDTPVCPKCSKTMRMDHSYPVLFTDSVDQVTYVCQTCGAESIRTVIRPTR
jgi:DNA-directed RNA polymerase subunit RPC12/RpoP